MNWTACKTALPTKKGLYFAYAGGMVVTIEKLKVIRKADSLGITHWLPVACVDFERCIGQTFEEHELVCVLHKGKLQIAQCFEEHLSPQGYTIKALKGVTHVAKFPNLPF